LIISLLLAVDKQRLPRAAFSLTELLVVLAALGIFVTVGIMSIGGVDRYAASSVAQRNLDLLNGAVNSFNNSNWRLSVPVDAGSGDEQTVFYSLQYRDADNPAPGSPYLGSHVSFTESSSAQRYRAVWNGTYFQMTEPGIDGTGIDLEGMNSGGGEGPPQSFRPPTPSAD